MSEGTVKVIIGVTAVLVIAGLILLLTSFADVHYYEMGFLKSTTTGSVDTSRVYSSGRRWIGPAKTFKTFSAVSQSIDLDNASVLAAPDKLENNGAAGTSGASLSITLSVRVIYFLVADDLKLLHDEYDVNYEGLMMNSAQSALKDTASMYTLQQFYSEREEVEQALLRGVQRRLGGICCPVNCSKRTSDCDSCKPRDQCADIDKGLFVEVRYLQLTDIKIPAAVEERNLRALRITEETAKETFTQQAAVIEKETEQIVENILNQALEVTANATAQSRLIAAKSEANYRRILEDARRQGLVLLFNSLGVSDETRKNSFDYLRSLAENSNAHLTVDFDQLIMGPTRLP